MDRPSTVTVDTFYLDELRRKALSWDQLQEELGEIHAARIREDMDSTLSPSDKIDITRAVPFDQTIVVTNLPSTISGAELMYSFLAPGGIRCYKLFFEPGKGKDSLVALITFATSDAAKNYLSYISKHGVFFISEKLTEGYLGPPGIGEYLRTSANGRFKFLLRPLPTVRINPWVGVERVAGKIINGDEGGYCDVAQAIKQGATRVLLIFPGMEAKQVQEELRHLVAAPELKIELNRLLPAKYPHEGKITIIRFCSVRDAVMVKNYLSFLKSFSSSGGRTVEYCKDPMDYPTEDLGWHKLAMPKKISEPLTNGDSNSGTKITTGETKTASEESEAPIAEKQFPRYPSQKTADTDAEESDGESELRELSFSLAKLAFLPHIPTSPTRGCFPTLCHTPAPGDHTPAQLEHGLQPGTNSETKAHYMSEEDSRPKADESIIPVITIEETNLQPEDTPKRPRYPHEIYLSQGRAAGKKKVGALKKVFGASGDAARLKTAVSSPDLSWVKDASGSILRVETFNDKPTTPSSGAQLKPLPGHPLRSTSPTPSVPQTAKSPPTDHEITLERYREEEQKLLNVAAISARLKIELPKTAKEPESEKQTLGADQAQWGADLPWKSSPKDKISASGEDNFLGGWEDNF